MSFSTDIKTELCALKTGETSKAELYGCLLFAGHFSATEPGLFLDNEKLAHRVRRLSRAALGTEAVLREAEKGFFVTFCDDRFSDFSPGELDRSLLPTPEHLAAFVRGVFLICGRISDPMKGYHLEFDPPDEARARQLQTLLQELSLPPKLTQRSGQYRLYYKDGQQVEDVITLMGATNATLQMINVQIYKDVRNKANRITNCETANIAKTVQAAVEQVQDIHLIEQTMGLESLPEGLQLVARARLENEEASLAELCAIVGGLSRSGINHRLARIGEIAKRIREKQ